MNAQYRKNLKAVLEASKNYTDKVANDLQWQLGTYDLGVDTNTDTAHIKTLPSGTIQTTVAKVDGVGYKVNQLVQNGNFATAPTVNGGSAYATTSVSNNVLTFTLKDNSSTITYNSNYRMNMNNANIQATHKYLYVLKINTPHQLSILLGNGNLGAITTLNQWVNFNTIFTNIDHSRVDLYFGDLKATYGWEVDDVIQTKDFNLFDLTADFGSGNEPTSVSDCASAYLQRGINIYEYTPQQSSIKNNAFTGVTVEGANNFDINTVYSNTSNFTINGDVVTGVAPYVFTPTYSKRNFTQDEIGKTFKFRVLFTSNCSGSNLRVVRNIGGVSGDGTLVSAFPNYSYVTITPTSTSDYVSINYSNATTIEIGEVMLSEGNDIVDYKPYTSTTIPIDLTTIKDSNNVSLFPSGKLMGNSSVADFITPYNQESRWFEELLKDLNFTMVTDSGVTYFTSVFPSAKLSGYGIISKYSFVQYTQTDIANILTSDKTFTITGQYYSGTTRVAIRDDSYNDATAFKNHFTDDDVVQVERATYLTSTTDLTSLTKINAQSNGTITLNNTDNVDMPNTIKYLKEVAK